MKQALPLVCVLVLGLAACGGSVAATSSPHADGSTPDTSVSSKHDASSREPDSAPPRHDAGESHDATVHRDAASLDGGVRYLEASVGHDAPTLDAGRDSGADAGTDAPPADAGTDALPADAGLDAPFHGFDAGCIPTCSSNEACQDTCAAVGFESPYCCDLSVHECFGTVPYEPCPLPRRRLRRRRVRRRRDVRRVPPGTVRRSARGYPLPATCTHDPTCACLQRAGVCGDGGLSFCADGGGASITCDSF